ncbi:MAG: sel1 repeat family protein [Methylocystaceae bacterium]|nr:sel1 repeat family protein [Methylocystaceae bacterium]
MFKKICFAFGVLCLLWSQASAESTRDLADRLESMAEHGDISAAYKLGLLFSQGKRVSPDFYTASYWFEKSAQGGYVRGMLKIADMYEEGKGVDKDLQKSVAWNEKAAFAGSKKAMVKLGQIFEKQENFDESARWFKKAAIKGDVSSMRELGIYYLKGTGVRFDLELAYAWLDLAVQKGDYQAKSEQAKIMQTKGMEWADGISRKVSNRMVPEDYWDAH